jgi:hypothetical protein
MALEWCADLVPLRRTHIDHGKDAGLTPTAAFPADGVSAVGWATEQECQNARPGANVSRKLVGHKPV